MDFLPSAEIEDLTHEGLAAYVASKFSADFGDQFTYSILAKYYRYANMATKAAKYVMYAMTSDTGCACGNLVLAKKAAMGLRAKGYTNSKVSIFGL